MTPQVHTRSISRPITELAVRQFSIQMAYRRQVHHVMGPGCVRTKRLMFQSLNVDTPSALRWAQVSSSDALDSSSRPETDLLQLTTPSIFAQVFLGRILSWWQRSLYCRRRGVLMGVALIRMVEVRLQVVVQGLRISLVKKKFPLWYFLFQEFFYQWFTWIKKFRVLIKLIKKKMKDPEPRSYLDSEWFTVSTTHCLWAAQIRHLKVGEVESVGDSWEVLRSPRYLAPSTTTGLHWENLHLRDSD